MLSRYCPFDIVLTHVCFSRQPYSEDIMALFITSHYYDDDDIASSSLSVRSVQQFEQKLREYRKAEKGPIRFLYFGATKFTLRASLVGDLCDISHLVNIPKSNMLWLYTCRDLCEEIYETIQWFKQHAVK